MLEMEIDLQEIEICSLSKHMQECVEEHFPFFCIKDSRSVDISLADLLQDLHALAVHRIHDRLFV